MCVSSSREETRRDETKRDGTGRNGTGTRLKESRREEGYLLFFEYDETQIRERARRLPSGLCTFSFLSSREQEKERDATK